MYTPGRFQKHYLETYWDPKQCRKARALLEKSVDGSPLQKPFLKWVGGKTQILPTLLSYFPKKMANYHEPFLGGGSVLLAVLSLRQQNKIVIEGKIYASDVNAELIRVYQTVQSKPKKLSAWLRRYINVYDTLESKKGGNRAPKTEEQAKECKESYYYWLRARYNQIRWQEEVEGSALFILLNKLCFRGVYREGPHGFNVPYGHYKTTPYITSQKEICALSRLFKDVVFKAAGFEETLMQVKEGDFVYLDPPYAPVNSKSFVSYVAGGFNLDNHNTLFERVKDLDPEVHFVMSNADVDLVTGAFAAFVQIEVAARRAIHSKNPSAKASELIIHNNINNTQ